MPAALTMPLPVVPVLHPGLAEQLCSPQCWRQCGTGPAPAASRNPARAQNRLFNPKWASETQSGLWSGHGDQNSITGWCTTNIWVSGGVQLVVGTLAFHALIPTPHFILTWAFHGCICFGAGRRCPGDRVPISTSWDPSSSDSHPVGPLWQLLPLTVPTKGGASQERFGAVPNVYVWAKAEDWEPGVEEHHPYMEWETPDSLPL